MKTRSVVGADGRRWDVRRRWLRLPRWRSRHRGGGSDGIGPFDVADFGLFAGDDPAGCAVGIGVAILLVLVAPVFVYVILPVLLFLGELALVLLLAMVAVAGKVLFRRPWVVEAVTAGPPAERFRRRVVGWRASGEAIDEVADFLGTGGTTYALPWPDSQSG